MRCSWMVATAVALSGCSDDDGGGRGGSVTLRVGPSDAAFVAAQSGDGAWNVVPRSSTGTYTFAATASAYGIAVVCANERYQEVTLLHATVGETTTPSVYCVVVGERSATLSGTVAGTEGELAVVYAGHFGVGDTEPDVLPYSLMTTPGTFDVYVARGPIAEVDRIIREPAVMLTAGETTTLDLDFATEGFALEPHTVTFDGLVAADRPFVDSLLRGKLGGTYFDMSQAPGAYRAAPASQLDGEDINVVTAVADQPPGVSRRVRHFFVAPQDFTASLPALPRTPLIEVASASPYLRLHAAIPGDVEMDRYDIVYTQMRAPGSDVMWTASLSKGYRETSGAESYTLPDLASFAGFDASWGLAPGTEVDYDTQMISSSADISELFRVDQTAAELDGRIDTISGRSGQFVP